MKQVYQPQMLVDDVYWTSLGLYKDHDTAYDVVLFARRYGWDARLSSFWVPNGTQIPCVDDNDNDDKEHE